MKSIKSFRLDDIKIEMTQVDDRFVVRFESDDNSTVHLFESFNDASDCFDRLAFGQ